jgi:hypothetical protein
MSQQQKPMPYEASSSNLQVSIVRGSQELVINPNTQSVWSTIPQHRASYCLQLTCTVGQALNPIRPM